MRNCGCCKYEKLSPTEFPCSDCSVSNHWEAAAEEEMKLCINCIFRDREISEEPCASCTTYKNWRSDTKIRCGTCQFMDKGINEDPCDICLDHDLWQAEEEDIKMEKDCSTCKYEGKNVYVEPCVNCLNSAKWEHKYHGDCSWCKYSALYTGDEPCNSCDGNNNWKLKEDEEVEDHDCDTCKYKELSSGMEPCCSCFEESGEDKWQSADTEVEETDSGCKTCSTCKFNNNTDDLNFPCCACNDNDEWKPKEEKMKVINLDNGYAVLIGYDEIKILQCGEILADICNPVIKAVMYKLIKKLEEDGAEID